ncbi:MAG TPA: MFS transporter [Steroidobacteraceae bacterium]|nr:MFS transporter [Steroidobacteraceae bacterium]
MQIRVAGSTLGVSGGVRPIQIVVLGLCLLVNALDGYDLQAAAFTSTSIMSEWGVATGAMGLTIFSVGVLGVGLGSFVLAPVADRLGRRPTVLIGLLLITVGMLTVSITATPLQLSGLRFLTGLGIGILFPTLNTLVSEYTPVAWQSLAVSVYATGYPIGAALSGALAPALIGHFGWRSVYVAGGAASLLLTLAVIALLPESLEFLLKVQPRDALQRARVIAIRLQVAPVDALPARQAAVRPSPLTPFEPQLVRRTLLISAAFFLLWLTEFFVVTWTPTILSREGLSLAAASRGGVMLTLGGMAGTLLVGAFGMSFGLVRVVGLYLCASFFMTLVFAVANVQASMVLVCAVLGFLLFGSAVGLYAVAARIFPLEVRATGTGVALAFGRAGAVVGLSLGGLLMGLGWARGTYVSILALPVVAAALATFALRPFVSDADPS